MPYCPSVRFDGQLPPTATIYHYLDPNEFRLLEVHGYDHCGILHCSLRHLPFEKAEISSYAAISYTWNPRDKLWYSDYDDSEKPIRINGVVVLVADKVANIICLALQVQYLQPRVHDVAAS